MATPRVDHEGFDLVGEFDESGAGPSGDIDVLDCPRVALGEVGDLVVPRDVLRHELGLPDREPIGRPGERARHRQSEFLLDVEVMGQPGHCLQGIAVGLGEHRLLVLDDLEAQGVPEASRAARRDLDILRDLAAPHGCRPAEQGALDVVRVHERGGVRKVLLHHTSAHG